MTPAHADRTGERNGGYCARAARASNRAWS